MVHQMDFVIEDEQFHDFVVDTMHRIHKNGENHRPMVEDILPMHLDLVHIELML